MKLILMTAALVMGAPALAHAPQDMSTTTAQSASGDAAMPGGYDPSQPPMPMHLIFLLKKFTCYRKIILKWQKCWI